VKSSKVSVTDVESKRFADGGEQPAAAIINACAAAAAEFKETLSLAKALETENQALRQRLETESRISAALTKLTETREAETLALRTAITAKDETIAAKNALIENRREMIEALKKKPASPLKRIADVLIGAAIFAILK